MPIRTICTFLFPLRCQDYAKLGAVMIPQARAAELHASMPFYLHIHSLFWGRGSDECKAHQALAPFRLEDVPGQEWFQLEPKDACAAVARVLG